MSIYRYSEWEGQDLFDLSAEELMEILGGKLMSYGDLSQALRQMQRGGIRDKQGRRLPSVEELLQRLRQKKQGQLEKYELGSVMDDIRKRLNSILELERQGIQDRLDEARLRVREDIDELDEIRQRTREDTGKLDKETQQKLLETIEAMAAQNLEKLDNLPKNMVGQLKGLVKYDFMDAEAERQFKELTDMLRKNAMQSFGRDLLQKLKDMDASALAKTRYMTEALNQLLEQRMRGEEPDFDSFIEQFGDYFGPQPPQNLDELMQRLQEQIAQAQSLLDSLSPEDREAMDNILKSMLDEGTQLEMAKMAANLEALYPGDKLRKQYPFSGEESVSFDEALKVMEVLQKMDKLETQLRDSQHSRSLDDVDKELLREVIDDEAVKDLERIRAITDVLEDAGYIRLADDKYELTPRGMKKIGQKALEDIFAQLRRDRIGEHNLNLRDGGGERIDETKRYEFGDEFQVHLQKTVMNSIYREPRKPPMRLSIDDFEIYRTEALTRSATVLMLDLSSSMPIRGNFEAAKRVALALDGLIRSRYPKDSLQIVGFSSYARKIKAKDLSYMNWDEFDPYTNMQHGFYVARKLLTEERCPNKQIILISDGEPTAHFEGEDIFFQYPPTLRTLQLTLKEVRNCTQKGIVINTFMLESGRFLSTFVTQMARVNKGRVFFANADSLGQYLLVDYISNKKRNI